MLALMCEGFLQTPASITVISTTLVLFLPQFGGISWLQFASIIADPLKVAIIFSFDARLHFVVHVNGTSYFI